MSLSIPTGLSSPFRRLAGLSPKIPHIFFQSQPGCHLHFDESTQRPLGCRETPFNPNRAVISISTIQMLVPFLMFFHLSIPTGLSSPFRLIRVFSVAFRKCCFQSQPGCHLHFDEKGALLHAKSLNFQSQPGCHLHFDRMTRPCMTRSDFLSIPTGLSSPFRRKKRS